MNFTFYDLSTGEIRASGHCGDREPPQPRSPDEGVLYVSSDHRIHRVENGKIVPFTPPPPPPPPYDELRRREYPPLQDQVDALWKGGTDAAAMKAKIDAVKAKYQKPVTP